PNRICLLPLPALIYNCERQSSSKSFNKYASLIMLHQIGRLLLLVLLCAQAAIAQQSRIKFEHLSVEQGLSQSLVTSIVQDRQGFIWFGTIDGLNRYDGYGFAVYRHIPKDNTSLVANEINTIFEDSEGLLWIGTANGLSCYDAKTRIFTSFF